MKRERINSIDSLKGISCLVIAFLWHYLNMQSRSEGMPFQSIFNVFYNVGQYFVELFFMISGFVMAYCYKDKIDEGMEFFPYMAKRYKHLYPLFFDTLMVTLILQVLYYAITGTYYVYKVSPWHFALNLLCIQTGWLTLEQSFNGPAWCISVEIFLYILYYITTKISKKDENLYAVINLSLATSAIALIWANTINRPIINIFMLRGIACFYIGTLICQINNWLEREMKKKLSFQLLLGFIIFRIALHFSPYDFWETERIGQFLLILVEWPIVLFAVINEVHVRNIMEIKPLMFLGNISMDIFLWHIPVQIFIKTVDNIFDLNIDYASNYIWFIYVVLVIISSIISNIVHKKYYGEGGGYFAKFLVTIICLYMIVAVADVTGLRLKSTVNNSCRYSDLSGVITCESKTTLSEEFLAKSNTHLEKIQFYTITWGNQYDADQFLALTVLEKDSGRKLYSQNINMSEFKDGDIFNVNIKSKPNLEAEKWYVVEITSNTRSEQEKMALMITTLTNNFQGKLFINGKFEDAQHIAMKLWTRER